MATVVNIIGYGGQQFAEKYLGWNRNVIRKGREEIDNEKEFVSQHHLCGRKKAEYHNPDLLLCIKKVVEPTGQTDPTFRSTRIYTPLTAKEIRNRSRGKEHEFYQGRKRAQAIATARAKGALERMR